MAPRHRHLMRGVRHTLSAKFRCQIGNQSALVVVVEPILQIMKTRKIFARANTAAVAIELDVMQKIFRAPIFFRLVQHSRKRERRFKKRPAIQSGEIHRGRFDSVIDLERVRFVARAEQRLAHRGRSLADRQRFPIILFRQRNQAIELRCAFEDGFERQPRFKRERGRTNQNNRNKS